MLHMEPAYTDEKGRTIYVSHNDPRMNGWAWVSGTGAFPFAGETEEEARANAQAYLNSLWNSPFAKK